MLEGCQSGVKGRYRAVADEGPRTKKTSKGVFKGTESKFYDSEDEEDGMNEVSL